MNDDICMNIFDECCICLENNSESSIELYCCKHEIHIKCLFKVFLYTLLQQFDTIQCALCRKDNKLSKYFTIEETIILFNNQPLNIRNMFIHKIKNIIIIYNTSYFKKVCIDLNESTIYIANPIIEIPDFIWFMFKSLLVFLWIVVIIYFSKKI